MKWRNTSVFAVLLAIAAVGPVFAQSVTFPLQGVEEVPPVTTDASGVCTGTLNALETAYDISCTQDVDDAIMAHIHNGPSGVNGPIVFFFDVATAFSGTVTAESLMEQAVLHQGAINPISFAEFKEALKSGDLYVNVHSTANPGGEIRGQIPPPPQSLYFPQFGNGEGLSSDIVLVNPAATGDPVTASIVLLDPEGNPLSGVGLEAHNRGGLPAQMNGNEVSIEPMGQVTLRTDGMGDLVVGSAAAFSDGPLGGVVRFSIPGFGVAGVGASPALTSAIVPVRNEGTVRSAVAIRNTSDFEITVTLHLWFGEHHFVIWFPIPAQGRVARFVDELFTETGDMEFAGTLTIEVDEGSFAAISLEQGPGAFTTLPVTPGEPSQDVWLTLLHNNDGESDLIDLGSGREDFGGVARFKTLVDLLRAAAVEGEAPHHLAGAKRCAVVVSSGDNFLAGPELTASFNHGVPYYDSIAMDLIGYDAIAIGNHEFDFGPDVLANFVEGFVNSDPTFVSSNLDFSAEAALQALVDQGRIAHSTIVETCGDRFGIIGATTPNLGFLSSPRDVIIMDDVAAAVQAEVDSLESAGVNKIILISHLQDVDEDLALAAQLTGVDVMVAGGGDELLANDDDLLIPGDEPSGPYPLVATNLSGARIPVVTTSGSYGYVGRLVVGFDRRGNFLGVDSSSGPVRVAGGDNPDAVGADPDVQAQVVDPVVAAVAGFNANVIAASEVDLDGVRADVRSVETNEGDLIADSQLWQARALAADFGMPMPDVSLQNGGGIRNDSIIPAGDVTELDTFDMVPFLNFVAIIPDISRSQFKEILENAVSRVPGDGRFAQVGGFSFSWSASGVAQTLNDDGTVATPGTRIQTVRLDEGGETIVDNGVVVNGPALTVATIDFLARGGDQYPFRGAPFVSIGVTYQQALINYIVDQLGGTITAADYPEGGEGRILELP